MLSGRETYYTSFIFSHGATSTVCTPLSDECLTKLCVCAFQANKYSSRCEVFHTPRVRLRFSSRQTHTPLDNKVSVISVYPRNLQLFVPSAVSTPGCVCCVFFLFFFSFLHSPVFFTGRSSPSTLKSNSDINTHTLYVL